MHYDSVIKCHSLISHVNNCRKKGRSNFVAYLILCFAIPKYHNNIRKTSVLRALVTCSMNSLMTLGTLFEQAA